MLIACHPANHETQITDRFIDGAEFQSSTSARFFEEVEVARWDFSKPDEFKAWLAERIDLKYKQTKTGIRMKSSSPDPVLSRDVTLDTNEVKAIRVRLAGLTSDAYMQLYWAKKGEPFSEKQTMGVSTPDPDGALTPSYTFNVQQHPAWKGKIGRLRLDPTSIADRELELYSMVALNYVPKKPLISAVCKQPWRVDIRGAVQNAILTPPGFDFQHTAHVPPNALLDFSIGLEPRMTEAVTFEITAKDKSDDEKIIFNKELSPGDFHWHHEKIDIRQMRNKEVSFRFRCTSSHSLDLLKGFPSWGNIQIISPPDLNKPRPRNVIVIIVDTLRADAVSSYGCSNHTTPNMDAWAQEHGVLFENTVASAPWTLPSHTSIFTGLDALSHGVNSGDPVPDSLTTMAEIFAAQGYSTRAITGGAYLTDTFGITQGFDTLNYWIPPSGDPRDAGNDIEDNLKKAIDFLDSNTNQPFLLFFHTYEVHTPYRKREPYFTEFNGSCNPSLVPPVDTVTIPPVRENGYVIDAKLQARYDSNDSVSQYVSAKDHEELRNLYDAGVAFADENIGHILDKLKENGLDKDTVVVMTSDHGETLGEHNYYEHKNLEETNLMVPLIISSPDFAQYAGERISKQVRLIDILPTLLEMTNLPVPKNLDGVSLTKLIKNETSDHPENAWSYASSSNSGLSLRQGNRLKYVFNNAVWPQVYGQQKLFDLQTDPMTNDNLAPQDERIPQLYALASREFQERNPGLRIQFSNQTSMPMEAHLKGRIIEPTRIKGFDVKANFFEWRYQMLNLKVAPRQSFVIHIEGSLFGAVFMTASYGSRVGHRKVVKHIMTLQNYSGPWQAEFDGSRWLELGNPDLQNNSGVKMWVEGDISTSKAPKMIDETTHGLLKKLGYIQ